MAKIMYGSLAGALSGALGNDVFSHGRHGAYIRRRTIPTSVLNANTLKVKNILTVVSRSWGQLSAEAQAAWQTWANSHPITDRLGQKQSLHGSGAFNELNCRLLLAGDTVITLPPAVSPPAPLTTLSAVMDASAHTCILTFAATPVGAANRLWINVGLVNSQGVGYMEGSFKLVSVSAKNAATTLGIGAAVETRFGTLITTEKYVVRAQVFDSATGLLSAPKSFAAAVVA